MNETTKPTNPPELFNVYRNGTKITSRPITESEAASLRDSLLTENTGKSEPNSIQILRVLLG